MKKIIFSIILTIMTFKLNAFEIKVNGPAPIFKIQTHEGLEFDLSSRKGKWTVLYFFPKAETPGCTKQACSFRDSIKKIRALDADVFGVSTNNVAEQAAFHKNHQLNFILLADDKIEVTKMYEAKMLLINYSKRWTYIIDPQLIIREIKKDVDPIADAQQVIDSITKLKAEKL